jgi:hypothetical protein
MVLTEVVQQVAFAGAGLRKHHEYADLSQQFVIVD